ncbi:hypothetical protein [Candidatus Methylomirabilis sp.]|uniref:hypothetical protein n=1 Tax=Candidatus Methylomirabilis sp. TaxID=2032687 RepID=UPI0030766957
MIDFILNPKFFIPFLSTAGASLTIIILQSIYRIDTDRKKKLYTVSYMAAVSLRLLQSSLILKNNTIVPHIEAAKKIISGDQDLLEKTFSTDEFDVLTDGTIEFNAIPEERKVLIGFDDIELLQAFEMLQCLNKIDNTRQSLNEFVKDNLKSRLLFENKSTDERDDILNTYWDYLDKLDHERDRLIAFVLHIFLPGVRTYIGRKAFFLYSKKNITKQLDNAEVLRSNYKNIIPDSGFFERSVSGGIQRIVKGET